MQGHETFRLWILRLETYGVGTVMAAPPSAAMREFGARVRARRNELGESQEQLAHRCGLHWSFIGQVERGQRNLTLHSILRIAAALKVDPGVLVHGLQPPAE